ncbi:unnamed protein product [Sphagnum balticum]
MSASNANTAHAATTATASSSTVVRAIDWRLSLQPILNAVTHVLVAFHFALSAIPIRHDDGLSLRRALADQLRARHKPVSTATVADVSKLPDVVNAFCRVGADSAAAHIFSRKYDNDVNAAQYIAFLLGMTVFDSADDLLAFVYAYEMKVFVTAVDYENISLSQIQLFKSADGIEIESVSGHPRGDDPQSLSLLVYTFPTRIGYSCGFLSARPLHGNPHAHACFYCHALLKSENHLLRHELTHYFPSQYFCPKPACPRPWKSDGSNMQQHDEEVHGAKSRSKRRRDSFTEANTPPSTNLIQRRRQSQSHPNTPPTSSYVAETPTAVVAHLIESAENVSVAVQQTHSAQSPLSSHQQSNILLDNVFGQSDGTSSAQPLYSSGCATTVAPEMHGDLNAMASFQTRLPHCLLSGQQSPIQPNSITSATHEQSINAITRQMRNGQAITAIPALTLPKAASTHALHPQTLRPFRLEGGTLSPMSLTDDSRSWQELVADNGIFLYAADTTSLTLNNTL